MIERWFKLILSKTENVFNSLINNPSIVEELTSENEFLL